MLANLVTIDSGTIEALAEKGVQEFLGIPYAAPPVGDLRWQPPQPAMHWPGVRPAQSFGSDCIQAPNDIEKIRTTPSEDCLFVNVWRPADAQAGAKLPVMVWIHGGGFVGGGSSIPWYDGSAFAKQGIVVVSFNYRLGRLGFFAHPALLATGQKHTGNFGIMDQIAVLRWVQRNISAFGGDPRHVTLIGESAGGASVLALLNSPTAKDLFQQAVVLSGGGRNALLGRQMTGGTPQNPSADQIDKTFAESIGINGDGSEALAALRSLPAATVQGDFNLENVAQEALAGKRVYQGTQMVDGEIVTDQPGNLLARADAAHVPLIIGTTAVDLPLSFPPSPINPLGFFGPDADKARAAYQVPARLDRNNLAALLLSIGADMTMHEPVRYVARQITAHGSPAWLYRFTYTADAQRPQTMQQTHAGELPFLFDQLAARYGDAVTAHDEATARAFNTYIANFVKTGDPNGSGLPAWPKFTATNFDLLHFAPDGPVFTRDPRADRIELVEQAYARAGQ